MAEQNEPTRRRPVDALFGDSPLASPSNFIVEPPRPVTTVTPPPPAPVVPPPDNLSSAESKSESKSKSEPAPIKTSSEPETIHAPVEPPRPVETVTDVPTFTSPPPIVRPVPPPAEKPLSFFEEARFSQLSDRVTRLYGEVKIDLRDSPRISTYCMDMLLRARQAIEAHDFARAENCIELTDARLQRSERSIKATRGLGMFALWLWELLMLALGAGMIAITYVLNLTFFGLPVAPELNILIRAIGWCVVGSVLGALYNITWFAQFRDYDPAYNMDYVARPFKGMIVGGMLFVISQAGIFAGNVVLPNNVQVGPIFLYAIAALAGFKQEYVTEFFDNILKTMLRAPKLPDDLKAPKEK